MKRGILFAFTLLLLSACKTNDKTENIEIPTVDTLAAEQLFKQEQLAIVKAWEQLMKGTYYNADYFDLIRFNKSPYKSFGQAPANLGFSFKKVPHFTTTKMQVDGFSIHEGGLVISFYLDNNKLYYYDNTDPKDIYQVIEVTDKEILAEQVGTGKVISYKKYNTINDGLNEILITGKYEIVESGRIIEFHKDGSITGWPSFEVFDIPFDFVGLTEFDCILLSKNKHPNLVDYTLYEANFGNPIITLTKYVADWNNLNHKQTEEVLHLRKRY